MSSNSCPSKSEIQQIFKRLSSVQANKVCFDCNSKNPTWASVTYGIFICIDCSGIHRSLGVHLTFVRSTQLDSNWTWQQIRQMQLGGNSNATSFFRQHNCVTNDAQQKYKSRAAQLYRDKLHHNAAQAMRLHGTKLFIDGTQNTPSVGDEEDLTKEEKDFFEAENHGATFGDSEGSMTSSASVSQKSSSIGIINADLSEQGPNVEAALSMSPTQAVQKQEPRKSTIGNRKPGAKKLGAKKGGLGAQKVKKDFAEIEREAELADQVRDRMVEEKKVVKTKEEDEQVVASMRLAYQDLSLEQKRKEEKMKQIDPKKAAQIERLGMGAGGKNFVVSHSAITEMSTIEQEEPRGMSSNSSRSAYSSQRRDYDDDYDNFGGFDKDDDWRRPSSNNDDMGGSGNSSWEKEFEVLKSTNTTSSYSSSSSSNKNTKSEWNNNFDSATSKSSDSYGSRRNAGAASSSNADDAQKKFGGAKAISSDMYFSGDKDNGQDANLGRFTGSNSISSAEYFGRQEITPGSRYSGASMNAPDMDEVKESVKQGVSKVAGRLSNMASGVMTQIQDRYGY